MSHQRLLHTTKIYHGPFVHAFVHPSLPVAIHQFLQIVLLHHILWGHEGTSFTANSVVTFFCTYEVSDTGSDPKII